MLKRESNKMKKSRRILSIILLCILCYASFTGVIAASGSGDVTPFVNKDDVFLSNQDSSNEAYNKMLQAFADERGCQLEAYFPDYYAGAYIGKDGELIILTKDASENDLASLNKVCGVEKIEYLTAKNSYNELIEVKNILSSRGDIIMKDKTFDSTALSIGIRDNYNKIFIGISDLDNKELIEYLTKDIDPSLYKIYKISALQECGNYYPGDYIDATFGGSAGYKAQLTINGVVKIGFITAAHVTDGSNVYSGWPHLFNKIGNTIVEQNSGSVDAAFVELTGSNTFTNQVEGYNITAGVSVIPATGSTVYKIGSQSDITSGIVYSNINESWWFIDGAWVEFTNLCETSVSCIEGDSGGLMYTKSGTTYKVIGVIKGSGDGSSYATKHVYLPWTLSIIS
jgi:hypothetical protein